MKRALLLGSLALILGSASKPASADTIYSLNSNGDCSGCSLPAGTVNLHQNGSNDVKVTVSLGSAYTFASTHNSHYALAFDLSGVSGSVGVSHLSSNDFSFDGFGSYKDSGLTNVPGASKFQYAFDYDGNGTNTLSFDLLGTGLTESSFVSNGLYYFGVNVGVINHCGEDCNRDEWDSEQSGGNVGATLSGRTTTAAATPEPSSLLLLGTGLVTAGGMLRRKMAV